MSDGEVDGGLDIFRTRDVRPLEGDRCPQLLRDLLAPFRVDVSDDDLGSLLDEAVDCSPTDTGNAPGDDRDLSCQ